jgi:hypothetical protein
VHVATETAREGFQHLPGEVREHAVGEARDGVLLVDDERPAREPGGDTAGSGDEATEAHHHQRAVAPHDRERLQQRHRQAEGGRQPADRALAA